MSKSSFESADLTAGQLNAIVKKLGGWDMALHSLSENVTLKFEQRFRVWKTIKLGTGCRIARDFFPRAFQRTNCKIDLNFAWEAPQFESRTKKAELDLVLVSRIELGFYSDIPGFRSRSATRKEIYERAQKLGLSLCPIEVGPQLRLHYLNQQIDDQRLVIGMNPWSPREYPALEGGFELYRDESGLWLSAQTESWYWDRSWYSDDKILFVFVLPRA